MLLGPRLRTLVFTTCAAALGGVAFWLRYLPLGINSLWLDDAWVAEGSRVSTIGDTIRTGLTSPGFSVLYRAWATVFGHGATTAQYLSFVVAVATPVLIVLVAVERRLPLFAALLGGALLATAPAHIQYSTRLKQYTTEAFAATIVLWFAWRVLERPGDTRRWVVFAGGAVAATLLSSVGAVIAADAMAVAFIGALAARPRRLRPALVAGGSYAVVAGLWTLLAVKPNVPSSETSKLSQYWRGFFLSGSSSGSSFVDRMEALVRGFQSLEARVVLAALVVAAVLVLIRRPLVGLLLVSPTVVAIVLAALTIIPLGTGRTDIYLFPSYALLLAVAVAEIASLVPAGTWLFGAAALAGTVALVLNATPAGSYGYPREELTPLVHLVEEKRGPHDVVLVYPNAGFAYGLATRYPVKTVLDPLSATGWAVAVDGPNIFILQQHRFDPGAWSTELDVLTRRSVPIWLVASHFTYTTYRSLPDWSTLLRMMTVRHYKVVAVRTRPGAEVVLMKPV